MRSLRLVSALWLALCGVALTSGSVLRADEPAAAEIEFFEARIRPLLISQCFTCHANGETLRDEERPDAGFEELDLRGSRLFSPHQ